MSREVVVVSAVRTAIGTFGGSLKDVAPTELGAQVVREALKRANTDGKDVGHVVFGHVVNTEPKDMYLSRVAAINGGCAEGTPAFNVNRLCGSGAQAIVSAVQSLMLGDAAMALAGGAECMSRSPYAMTTARFGQKMGDTKVLDMMTGALTCPFGTGHMGVTAENVAAESHISRADQDAFAVQSQTRAAHAIAQRYFTDQIAPIEVKTRKGVVMFDTDEHPKATSAEVLAGLRTVFQKEGTVTAGNASGINDGAAAIVLARADAAERAGLTPKFRLLGYGHAGVRPEVMGIGPVPAVENLMAKTGLTIHDFDVVESNEAFAAQAVAVNRGLGLDPARVNPNGGAIALGHPVGATGAIIMVKLMAELERSDGSKGLATMCIGGGQGIAVAIERI